MGKPQLRTRLHQAVTHVEVLQAELKVANQGLVALTVEMEDRVNKRTEQLQAVNEELESFAFSVSHDLRQPLRVIGGFSEALLEDYKEQLDEVGTDYLTRIHLGAKRMAGLIDDLLHLAGITGGALEKTSINLSEIAVAVAAQLRETAPDRIVDFDFSTGLVTQGDGRLMKIALENLLGNAWKFTAEKTPTVIEMGMLRKKNQKIFFVRDNGAGFNPEYSDKLFGAFQRLHRESEFPGNGIGLATVKRIIRRHGGKIWAEGKEGAGATFFFSL